MLFQDHVFVVDNRFGGAPFDYPQPDLGNMTLDPHCIPRSQLVMEAEVASLPRSQWLCHSQQQVAGQSYFSQHEEQHLWRTSGACSPREPLKALPLFTGNLLNFDGRDMSVASNEHQHNMALPSTTTAMKRSQDSLFPGNLPKPYEHHQDQLCKRQRMIAVSMQHLT